MPDIRGEIVIGQILAVLRESFDGAERWSYFTDHGAEAGLLGTLGKLSAAEASRPIGGSSIAAHAHHLAFGLEASAAWIRGDRTPRNWEESWRITSINDAGWSGLQDQLRDGFEVLRKAIELHGTTGAESIGGAIGAVAHVAYHLGAIRQKAALVRQG
jgi:hypothetical protein